ncbi:MAG: beta-N-acetylhexosaminidase, partial [Planctomycetota bacterium]
MKPIDLPLIPRPKHVDAGRFDAGKLDREPNVHLERSLARPQEYKLTLSPKGPFVVAGDDSGVRAALRTLDQLRALAKERPKKEPMPVVLVEDWADVPRRGFMLDVSRDRIPKQKELLRLPKLLARLGFDELQLYVEHVFAYPGLEEVWKDLDPLTTDEVRELDARCAKHGVELVANQNCFGHLAGILRAPSFAALAETHDVFRFLDFEKQGPFSLCPTDPRSLELVRGFMRTIADTFGSKRVHVGCDETFDVGQGRSRAEVEARGRAVVCAKFTAQVARAAHEFGLHPMFWADVALGDPRAFELLPDDLEPVAWGYEPDSPLAEQAAALRDLGRSFRVAPGTSCWRTFAGRTSERRGNLAAASTAAAEFGANGLLTTAWGDLGHRQGFAFTLRGLADAAEAGWNAGSEGADPEAVGRVVFGETDGERARELVEWIDDFGDLDAELREGGAAAGDGEPLRNASATFSELFPATSASRPRG